MSIIDRVTGQRIDEVIRYEVAVNGRTVAHVESGAHTYAARVDDFDISCDECHRDAWLPRCQFCGAPR